MRHKAIVRYDWLAPAIILYVDKIQMKGLNWACCAIPLNGRFHVRDRGK